MSRRWWWAGPISGVAVLCAVSVVVPTPGRSASPDVADGVCRSLGTPTSFAPVPADVVARTAETSVARLDGLSTPTVAQTTAARVSLIDSSEARIARWVDGYAACLVSDAGPLATRVHVPALLLYREQKQPVEPCFGGPGMCPKHPDTYPVDCAMVMDANATRVLRQGVCWGFRPVS